MYVVDYVHKTLRACVLGISMERVLVVWVAGETESVNELYKLRNVALHSSGSLALSSVVSLLLLLLRWMI